MSADWYSALSVLADHCLLASWQMTNGATFWHVLSDRSQLLPDRFADQHFLFSEIASVTIYREARAANEVFTCDWKVVRDALTGVPGLTVIPLDGARPWPTSPPTDALKLVSTSA